MSVRRSSASFEAIDGSGSADLLLGPDNAVSGVLAIKPIDGEAYWRVHEIDQALAVGAAKARITAAKVLDRVRTKLGM